MAATTVPGPTRAAPFPIGLAPMPSVIGLVLSLIVLIPSYLVLPGLGGAGSPGQLAASALLVLWVLARVAPARAAFDGRAQPMRYAMAAYATWFLVVYGLTVARTTDSFIVGAADRSMIRLLPFAALALAVADLVPTRRMLDRLLDVLVALSSIMAVIGMIQFATPFDPVALLRPPGLVVNGDFLTETSRWAFARPFSTASHSIEFGVCMALVLPIAVHKALTAPPGTAKLVRYGLTLTILSAIPLTVSRSAVLGLIVTALMLLLRWPLPRKLNLLAVGAVFLVGVKGVVPGLIGTIRNLTLGASNDPSIQGRLGDIDNVRALVSRNPWLGSGPGTFSPELNFVADNQYYGTAITTGLVGLVLLLVLVATGCWLALRTSRQGGEPGELAYAVLISIVIAAVSMATFDAFVFRTWTAIFAVLLGTTGVLWRIEVRDRSTCAREVGDLEN